MRAGLLKESIEILTQQLTTSEYGEETTEWVHKYSTKARLIHDGGTRVLQDNEIFYTGLKTMEMRYYVPLTEFDRIVWNSNTYRILNIDPDHDHNKLSVKLELIND